MHCKFLISFTIHNNTIAYTLWKVVFDRKPPTYQNKCGKKKKLERAIIGTYYFNRKLKSNALLDEIFYLRWMRAALCFYFSHQETMTLRWQLCMSYAALHGTHWQIELWFRSACVLYATLRIMHFNCLNKWIAFVRNDFEWNTRKRETVPAIRQTDRRCSAWFLAYLIYAFEYDKFVEYFPVFAIHSRSYVSWFVRSQLHCGESSTTFQQHDNYEKFK